MVVAQSAIITVFPNFEAANLQSAALSLGRYRNSNGVILSLSKFSQPQSHYMQTCQTKRGARLREHGFVPATLKYLDSRVHQVQRSEKWLVRGWVKFIPALP